jgi:rfaE bifunctional protein nucleotidyltransferase chain/domain
MFEKPGEKAKRQKKNRVGCALRTISSSGSQEERAAVGENFMTKYSTTHKVVDWEAAAQWVQNLQGQGKLAVFTNGCFDLLHLGHVRYLEAARSLGDGLIVGVNTNASVKRLGKGPGRPLNPEVDRARVLAALACVDRVVLFGEETPLALITLLAPDILVKGGDYQLDEIVGREVVLARGGRVVALPFVPGYSTTGLIERLRSGV